MEWEKLYSIAKKTLNPRTISPFIDAKTKKTVELKDLLPDWWGKDRFE